MSLAVEQNWERMKCDSFLEQIRVLFAHLDEPVTRNHHARSNNGTLQLHCTKVTKWKIALLRISL
jgi:hypothetical protein